MTFAPSLVGASLNQYVVEELIGRGGMAAVYRGRDERLRRAVAIKVLAPALAANPEYVARFAREAELIAGLVHPNIARVYDVGESGGLYYMVQELLPGPSLEQRMAELQAQSALMPGAEVLRVVAEIADALDAAHAVGVVHRDVKPGNVLFNARGEAVLTDFGIARRSDDPTVTQPGVVLGSPAYMAPEQGVGEPTGPATDVYALGVLAFELLSGRLPFSGESPRELMRTHRRQAVPSIVRLRPDLPPGVDRALRRALAKAPARRQLSATALAAELVQVWRPGDETPAATPTQRRTQSTQLVALAGPSAAAAPVRGRRGRHTRAVLPTRRPTGAAGPVVAPPAGVPQPAPAARTGARRLLLALIFLPALALALALVLWTRSGVAREQGGGPGGQTLADLLGFEFGARPTALVSADTAPLAPTPSLEVVAAGGELAVASAEFVPLGPTRTPTPAGQAPAASGAKVPSGPDSPAAGARQPSPTSNDAGKAAPSPTPAGRSGRPTATARPPARPGAPAAPAPSAVPSSEPARTPSRPTQTPTADQPPAWMPPWPTMAPTTPTAATPTRTTATPSRTAVSPTEAPTRTPVATTVAPPLPTATTAPPPQPPTLEPSATPTEEAPTPTETPEPSATPTEEPPTPEPSATPTAEPPTPTETLEPSATAEASPVEPSVEVLPTPLPALTGLPTAVPEPAPG